MPITARLSRRFYDKFGDDIVNELVEWLNQVDLAFRTELREVNEANFGRLDAKLDQRSAELRGEMVALRGEMATFRSEVRADLQSLKAEMIKWMFLFWAGSAFAGLLLK